MHIDSGGEHVCRCLFVDSWILPCSFGNMANSFQFSTDIDHVPIFCRVPEQCSLNTISDSSCNEVLPPHFRTWLVTPLAKSMLHILYICTYLYVGKSVLTNTSTLSPRVRLGKTQPLCSLQMAPLFRAGASPNAGNPHADPLVAGRATVYPSFGLVVQRQTWGHKQAIQWLGGS